MLVGGGDHARQVYGSGRPVFVHRAEASHYRPLLAAVVHRRLGPIDRRLRRTSRYRRPCRSRRAAPRARAGAADLLFRQGGAARLVPGRGRDRAKGPRLSAGEGQISGRPPRFRAPAGARRRGAESAARHLRPRFRAAGVGRALPARWRCPGARRNRFADAVLRHRSAFAGWRLFGRRAGDRCRAGKIRRCMCSRR